MIGLESALFVLSGSAIIFSRKDTAAVTQELHEKVHVLALLIIYGPDMAESEIKISKRRELLLSTTGVRTLSMHNR